MVSIYTGHVGNLDILSLILGVSQQEQCTVCIHFPLLQIFTVILFKLAKNSKETIFQNIILLEMQQSVKFTDCTFKPKTHKDCYSSDTS